MKKIIVIDDEPLILEVIQVFLESQGHTVFSFSNPEDIEQETLFSCDLLISDVRLGLQKDGLDYCLYWEQKGLSKPIIIISGFMPNPTSFQDHWTFLRKPFNRNTLIETVNRLLNAG